MWCCKCELKTEALIYAAIYTVGSGLSIISHLSMGSSSNEEGLPEEESSTGATVGGLIASILSFLVDGSLLYGIIKDKRLFLIPWLLVHGIMFFVVELLILIFSPLILFLIVGLIIAAFVGWPWYTIWKYFNTMDPNNLNHLPQTAVYAPPGFTNGQFVPDNSKPSAPPPGTVVYTPGMPAYNDIVAQPQNV